MDQPIFDYLNSLAGLNFWLDALIIFSSEYLGWWMVGGLGSFLIFSAYFRKGEIKARLMVANALVAAFLSRVIFTEIIRFFYSRPRPFDLPAEALAKAGVDNIYQLISHASGGSFPSGHAAFFFALAAGVFIYYKKWGAVFFAGAILIGLARIASGVHWPSDILAGAVLGIFSAYLIYFFLKTKSRLDGPDLI